MSIDIVLDKLYIQNEAQKKYPLRYPSNNDSIGIEIVGKFWSDKKIFDKITSKQMGSVKWLVDILNVEYGLDIKKMYMLTVQ